MFGKRQIPTTGGRLVEADEKVVLWPLTLCPDGQGYTVSALVDPLTLTREAVSQFWVTRQGSVDGRQETIYTRRNGMGYWYVLGVS